MMWPIWSAASMDFPCGRYGFWLCPILSFHDAVADMVEPRVDRHWHLADEHLTLWTGLNALLRRLVRFGRLQDTVVVTYMKMLVGIFFLFFCRAMLCISAAHAVVRCLSVRLSVTFVYFVETSKYIFKLFHDQPRHSSFPYQTLWRYSDENPIGAKIATFDFRIDDWSSVECRQRFWPWNKFIAPSGCLRL